ncbi:hypothetical protein [Nocardia carnea]|uniref:hypothetical protein n=1 Tax=Nocardia carnea TaxID=37328 RepID=UPI002453ABD1|nr:hypothetical protein [Nocardia carnea]
MGAARTVILALRDFALGVHLANGIRHGVPDTAARPEAPAPARRPVVRRAVLTVDEPTVPAFGQCFANPAAVSSSRV